MTYIKEVTVYFDVVEMSYHDISLSEWKNIVNVANKLAHHGIGPEVISVDNDSYTLITKRVKIVSKSGEVSNFHDKLKQLVEKLHNIGICHGDIIGNIGVEENSELVLIDYDTCFFFGGLLQIHRDIARDRYSFAEEADIEESFIKNDLDAIQDALECY